MQKLMKNLNKKMGKNLNKRIRKITVEGEIYYWLVFDNNCDGDGGDKFHIWKNKKVIYESLIHNEIITPKIVRETIIKLNEKI